MASFVAEDIEKFKNLLGPGRFVCYVKSRIKYGGRKWTSIQLTTTAADLFMKIKGLYAMRPEDIPHYSVVAFCTLNATDELNASIAASKRIHKAMMTAWHPNPKLPNITKINISECMKKNSARWVTFDVDGPSTIRKTLEDNGIPIHAAIKTKNGEHILIDTFVLTAEQKKLLYTNVKSACAYDPECTFLAASDNAPSPIPGTMQGGRMVHFTSA